MSLVDILGFTLGSLRGHRLRTLLMLLAMAIGVAAVVILTSLGEGARRYVTGEFATLGTHLIIVLPGKSETTGAGPSMFIGDTPRDLTLDDSLALTRSSTIRRIAPISVGSAAVSWQGREREVPILGSTSDLLEIRHWSMAQGKFLPPDDPTQASPVCVIGAKVRNELFGAQSALGEWVRIGDRRFRVIGIMATEGRSIGLDVQELVIIPVASAQMLFNSPSLFRIIIEARNRGAIQPAIEYTRTTLRERHQGEEDVTIITQDAVLSTFDRIFNALTLTVAGIATISLIVAGILIMNVMLVAITQRTAEIGLLKAIGASGHQIQILFLMEAAILSLIGAIIGLGLGEAGSWFIGYLYPTFPAGPPLWAVFAAIGVAILTGISFGTLPARRAARLDPVQALSKR